MPFSGLAGASPFGALDMAGNVWEWTADRRGSYPASAVTDPRGPATGSGRVDRGNGWHAHLASDVRAAVRDSGDPALPTNSTGLRCAVCAVIEVPRAVAGFRSRAFRSHRGSGVLDGSRGPPGPQRLSKVSPADPFRSLRTDAPRAVCSSADSRGLS